MWVVKIGGSLEQAPQLLRWLDTLGRWGRGRLVVVPGGGGFADQVRSAQQRWEFDERTAHSMAILAMHQYGLMLSSLCSALEPAATVAEVQLIAAGGGVGVWLPQTTELDRAGIPASWDITSDSLSAWLAAAIGARRLVLVKSAPVTEGDREWRTWQGRGMVDACFPTYAAAGAFEMQMFGRDGFASFGQELRSAEGGDPQGASPIGIFVFGSDLAGRHTHDDALIALRKHGAVYGRAVGLQGRSYAIPVQDENGRLLPLPVIERYVQAFLRFAATHREFTFQVTRIGCGRDKYRDQQIAPLFVQAPANCRLPRRWRSHPSS